MHSAVTPAARRGSPPPRPQRKPPTPPPDRHPQPTTCPCATSRTHPCGPHGTRSWQLRPNQTEQFHRGRILADLADCCVDLATQCHSAQGVGSSGGRKPLPSLGPRSAPVNMHPDRRASRHGSGEVDPHSVAVPSRFVDRVHHSAPLQGVRGSGPHKEHFSDHRAVKSNIAIANESPIQEATDRFLGRLERDGLLGRDAGEMGIISVGVRRTAARARRRGWRG